MPSLGADMEAGTLVTWLKQPGEPLVRGDIIAVVDTDKGAIDIEVFEDGVFDRALVLPGQKVPVGTVLALIRTAGETASTSAAAAEIQPPSGAVRRASPGARRRAEELDVDLAAVTGTGPAGTITREDVERAASRGRLPAPPAAALPAAPAPADKSAGMRAAIAAAMSRSKREIPHVYLSTTIDMTAATTWLAAENQRRSVERRLLSIALLLKAVARAATDVPELNGFWIDGRFDAAAGVHVGCAIALRDGGLVAPAIHDTHGKNLDGIMRDLLDLTARARRGSLRSSELTASTITVTNLGELGVEEAYAVIYPPQVAIVAFGRVMPRPWIVDGRVEPRTMVRASVSADHRAVDGRRAAQFLAAVEKHLQQPAAL
jgi:pyruvate dehydrogenase E2 component (dihydrolipoamide acetyltransferase)